MSSGGQGLSPTVCGQCLAGWGLSSARGFQALYLIHLGLHPGFPVTLSPGCDWIFHTVFLAPGKCLGKMLHKVNLYYGAGGELSWCVSCDVCIVYGCALVCTVSTLSV